MKNRLTDILNKSFADQYEKRGLLTARHTADYLIANNVVDVVRCKDCESYNGHRYCNYHADPVMDDDFCSYGERKEEAKCM